MAETAWTTSRYHGPQSSKRPGAARASQTPLGSRSPRRAVRRATTAPSSFPTCIWARAAARRSCSPTSSAEEFVRHALSRRRHRRWLAAEAPLVLDGSAHAKSFAKSCARSMTARASSTCRAITTSSSAIIAGAAWRASKWRKRPSTRPPTGQRLLVLHGDQFDGVIGYAKWLAHVGDWAYALALALNDRLHMVRRRLRAALLVALGLSQAQGQECGRICLALRRGRGARRRCPRASTASYAAISTKRKSAKSGPILYLNDGDWVESCTALVEDARGHLEILRWASPTPASVPARGHSGAQGEIAPIPA